VHPIWPLFDLRVRTPRLELRAIDDERAVRLARLAVAGIHEGPSPFRFPWNEGEPDEVMRRAMQHYWGTRASWTPEAWHMPFAVEVDGEVVGTQGIAATGFAVRRTVGSGSWLGKAHQGRGLGREMRAAVLHLAFAGLGAARAETEAWEDNARSIGVTRSHGYRDNGAKVLDRGGEATVELEFVLTHDEWEPNRRDDIEIRGLDRCLELFGAVAASGDGTT
jgi:RimJ/RimL family protein N-acetyltransferase